MMGKSLSQKKTGKRRVHILPIFKKKRKCILFHFLRISSKNTLFISFAFPSHSGKTLRFFPISFNKIFLFPFLPKLTKPFLTQPSGRARNGFASFGRNGKRKSWCDVIFSYFLQFPMNTCLLSKYRWKEHMIFLSFLSFVKFWFKSTKQEEVGWIYLGVDGSLLYF